MTSPTSDEVLRLADGRLLAWGEWGDPRGLPVLFLHSSPGSRMLCPDPAMTAAAGVRLITVDRPGYGRSDPVADPTLTGFAADVARLVEHLWLGPVAVVGWSVGGQHAAACAALLGDRVSAVALIATPAPDDEVPWLTEPLRDVASLARVDLDRALAVAASAAAQVAAAPEEAGDGWDSAADLAVRAQPDVETALQEMWREAFRAGDQGLAADLVAGSRPWGFSPAQVQAPTALFYGEDDLMVGLAHGRWWSSVLPQSCLTVVAGSGHLTPFTSWADILRAVAG